jgi:hypothetical protein
MFDLFRSIKELIQPFTCRYPIPAAMNKENIDLPENCDLSDIDKAYMAINYPRDLSSVLKALRFIDLDAQVKLNILEAYEAHDIIEMRKLLAKRSSSFPSRSPYFGTSQPVVESTTLLPEAVVSTGVTDIVQNTPNSPPPSLPPIISSTLEETESIYSFDSQTTVSTCVGRVVHLWSNPSPSSSVESLN